MLISFVFSEICPLFQFIQSYNCTCLKVFYLNDPQQVTRTWSENEKIKVWEWPN